MGPDPAVTNPDLYKLVFENDRVRVLEYRDRPGDRTTPHGHPDSVMITLSAFRRRLSTDGRQVEVIGEVVAAGELAPSQNAAGERGKEELHLVQPTRRAWACGG